MSEKCTACGLLSDPCFCSYTVKTLLSEIRRRGYTVKVFETKERELDL